MTDRIYTQRQIGDQDLLNIINCRSYKEFRKLYKDQIVVDTSAYPKPKRYPNNKISEAILNAFYNTRTSEFYTLLRVAALLGLTLFSLSLWMAGLYFISLLASGVGFANTYNNVKQTQEKNEKALNFLNVKRACYDELFIRQQIDIANLRNEEPVVYQYQYDIKLPEKKHKNRLSTFNDALRTFLYIPATLFGNIYLTAPVLLTVLGFTHIAAIMTGPIGLGIALGVTLAIGGYFAYKTYRSNKESQEVARYEKQTELELQARRKDYIVNDNLIAKLKAEKQQEQSQQQNILAALKTASVEIPPSPSVENSAMDGSELNNSNQNNSQTNIDTIDIDEAKQKQQNKVQNFAKSPTNLFSEKKRIPENKPSKVPSVRLASSYP